MDVDVSVGVGVRRRRGMVLNSRACLVGFIILSGRQTATASSWTTVLITGAVRPLQTRPLTQVPKVPYGGVGAVALPASVDALSGAPDGANQGAPPACSPARIRKQCQHALGGQLLLR